MDATLCLPRTIDLYQPYFVASTCRTAALSSASDAATFGWPLPSLILATSSPSAPLLPLYFAATSLYAGPTFFLSVSWQLRHPLAFSTSAPASPWLEPARDN